MKIELFGKKKDENNDKSTFEARLEAVEKKNRDFERRLLDLEMDFNVLRDKVLRKIQEKRKEPEIASESESLNTLKPGQPVWPQRQ